MEDQKCNSLYMGLEWDSKGSPGNLLQETRNENRQGLLVRVTSIVSLINIAQPFRIAVHLNKGPGQNATDDHDRGQYQRNYAGGG